MFYPDYIADLVEELLFGFAGRTRASYAMGHAAEV